MKRVGILFLALLMSLLIIPSTFAYADSNDDEKLSDDLKTLGILIGGTGTDNNSNVTRNEMITLLVRMLGKEKEALDKYSNKDIPFADVANWVKPYVSYAYHNNLTKGISTNTFGGNEIMDINQASTFMLRSLNYKDGYDWKDAINYAKDNNIINIDKIDNFKRSDLNKLTKDVLNTNLKGTTKKLINKLVEDKVISKEQIKNITTIVTEIIKNELEVIADKISKAVSDGGGGGGSSTPQPEVIKPEDCVELDYKIIKDKNEVSVRAKTYLNEAEETVYQTDKKHLIIPETVDIDGVTYNVTNIRGLAFCNLKSIKKVVIPDSITFLDEWAFVSCTNLEEITLGSQTKTILFDDIPNLKMIKLPKDSEYFCYSDGLIYSKDFKELLMVTSNCKDDVIINENTEVVKINYNMPRENINIHLTSKINEIDVSPHLININFCLDEESDYFKIVDGVLYDKGMTKLINYNYNKKDDSFIIPEGVKIINYDAFNNKYLKEVSIPKYANIRAYAFMHCDNLKKVYLYHRHSKYMDEKYFNMDNVEFVYLDEIYNCILAGIYVDTKIVDEPKYQIQLFFADGVVSDDLTINYNETYDAFNLDDIYTDDERSNREIVCEYLINEGILSEENIGKPIKADVYNGKAVIYPNDIETLRVTNIYNEDSKMYISPNKISVNENTKIYKVKRKSYNRISLKELNLNHLVCLNNLTDSYVLDIKYDEETKEEYAQTLIIGENDNFNSILDMDLVFVKDWAETISGKEIDVLDIYGNKLTYYIDEDDNEELCNKINDSLVYQFIGIKANEEDMLTYLESDLCSLDNYVELNKYDINDVVDNIVDDRMIINDNTYEIDDVCLILLLEDDKYIVSDFKNIEAYDELSKYKYTISYLYAFDFKNSNEKPLVKLLVYTEEQNK